MEHDGFFLKTVSISKRSSLPSLVSPTHKRTSPSLFDTSADEWSFLLREEAESELMSQQAQLDTMVVKRIQEACAVEKAERAMDLASLLHLEKSFHIAIKVREVTVGQEARPI